MKSFNSSLSVLLLGIATVACSAASARAEFLLIDDFEGYAPASPIHGQGYWQAEAMANATAAGIAVDPLDPGNRVLTVGAGGFTSGRLGHRETINTHPELIISQGTTATLFLRVAWDIRDIDLSLGMTDVANPISDSIFNSFTQFESQVGFSFAPGFDDIIARNGGGAALLTTEVQPLTWYDLWLVIDNAADTTQVYIQGGAFANQTLLQNGGLSEFAFRNGNAENDLVTFFIATGRNTDSVPPNATENIGPFYIDDLYIDTSGRNLTNPVPEASSVVLGLVGSLLFLTLAKRRAKELRITSLA